jgi:hypothetical protein
MGRTGLPPLRTPTMRARTGLPPVPARVLPPPIFGLPPPVFVLPPPSPSVLAILSFLRLLAVSVPDILVLVRILLGFSVIYLTPPLFLRVHFVPIRLPLLMRLYTGMRLLRFFIFFVFLY